MPAARNATRQPKFHTRECEPDDRPELRTHHVDPDCGRTPAALEVIGQERKIGGRAAGFRRADAYAHQYQRQEAVRHGAQRGEPAPQRDERRKQPDALHAIDQHAQRDPGDGEGDRIDRTCEQAELAVAQCELGADRHEQQGDHLPVEVMNHVDRKQEAQHVPAVPVSARV
jgi:hypothetical protein